MKEMTLVLFCIIRFVMSKFVDNIIIKPPQHEVNMKTFLSCFRHHIDFGAEDGMANHSGTRVGTLMSMLV